MRTFVIDVETTFSATHTLKKLPIEEYVRSPLCEVVGGCLIDVETGNGAWHDKAGLLDALEEGPCRLIAHHAHFDGLVLNYHLGYTPAEWGCTLSMSRARFPRWRSHSLDTMAHKLGLGTPKTVPYDKYKGLALRQIGADKALYKELADGCVHDGVLTVALYKALHLHFPQSELALIDRCVRMFTEPVLVGNALVLQEALEEAEEELEAAVAAACFDVKVLRSNLQFARVLEGHGIAVPMKRSPATKKMTHAFSKDDLDFLALKEHEDPVVRILVEARLAAKTSIAETRAARFLGMAGRGPLPVYLKYWGTHPGRFSGGDKSNWHNVKRGSKIARAIEAPEGYSLVWADASQIQARIVATVSGCETMRKAYEDGRDIYSEFGTILYGRPISRDTPRERYITKRIVLGQLFGMGREKQHKQLLVDGVKIDRHTSDGHIETIRRVAHEVPAFWRECNHILSVMNAFPEETYERPFGCLTVRGQKLILPNGMAIDYTGLAHTEDHTGFHLNGQNIWGGVVTENIAMALERIIVMDAQMLLPPEVILPVFTKHDEILCLVKDEDVELAREVLEEVLCIRPTWLPNLPLAAEVKSGKCYA